MKYSFMVMMMKYITIAKKTAPQEKNYELLYNSDGGILKN